MVCQMYLISDSPNDTLEFFADEKTSSWEVRSYPNIVKLHAMIGIIITIRNRQGLF